MLSWPDLVSPLEEEIRGTSLPSRLEVEDEVPQPLLSSPVVYQARVSKRI